MVAWIVDEQIIHDAGTIRNSGLYYSAIDDPKIHEILGKRIMLMWGLFVVLLLLFIFSLL